MNIVLVGSSSVRRNFVREIISGRLCPLRYVYHSFDNLPKKSYWVDHTELLIICEKYENNENICYSGKILKILENDVSEEIARKLDDMSMVSRKIQEKIQNNSVGYMSSGSQNLLVELKDGKLTPVVSENEKLDGRFDFEKYFRLKKSKIIGSRIVHFASLTSTEDVFSQKSVEIWPGLVVVADEQTKGKGRKANQWISPGGSLSMSFGFTLDLELEHLAPIQHLVAVAACKALRNLSGSDYIGCKWPNDIYWKREIKLGGIITRSSIMGSTFTVCVGIGLNLDNDIPYPGVNKLVKNSKVCREELIAEIFYNLENLIPKLKNGSWRDEYYAHWVHNDEKVSLEIDDKNKSGKIVGVDLDGFLQCSLENEKILNFDTDNNSFDLMKGLVHQKR